MFDITSDDINQLNDIDLRELVGRLCEAELVNRGLSTAAVTWGGNRASADGGLDVRVELPLGMSIEGFVPLLKWVPGEETGHAEVQAHCRAADR